MINILVSLNKKYLKYLMIMVLSFYQNHPKDDICFHIVSNDLNDSDLKPLTDYLPKTYQFAIYQFKNYDLLDTIKDKQYPPEVYFRLFAATYLPDNIERILYLDTDIIILKSIKKLYNINFEDNYFVGATNIKNLLTVLNNLKSKKNETYLNTGVLLINLELLRKEQDTKELAEYIVKNYQRFFLPDQDVLHALYGRRVMRVDHLIYNLSDKAIEINNRKSQTKIDKKWVDKNAVIIHYFGTNKPWNKNYRGILKDYYKIYEEKYNILTTKENEK